MTRPRRIGELIRPGESGFAGTLAKAERLRELESLLHTVLQPELASLVRVANRRGDTLVLVTPSAAVAARIRLEAVDLARVLRTQGGGDIGSVEIRVAPLPAYEPRSSGKRALSPAARRALGRVFGNKDKED